MSLKPGLGGPDQGASEVVGSILMVALTVAIAGAMVSVVYGAIPTDQGSRRASFSAEVHPNGDGWGTGDETVAINHNGGHALHADATAVVVGIDGPETVYEPAGPNAVDHGSQTAWTTSDREFTIGERWHTDALTIPEDARVSLTIVDREASKVIWTASLTASGQPGAGGGSDPCGDDSDAPTVSGWTHQPNDVTTDTSTSVSVTASLADGCSGVDQTQDPHLAYRIQDGTDPAFTDTGAMTHDGGTTWSGTISETWSDHGGATLEYKLIGMTDEQGNTGESTVRSEMIETISYVQTPLPMVTGTAASDTDARSADDAGAAATITEEDTGTTSSTDAHHGTASSGTADATANAEGSPDDSYTVMDASTEDVEVSGYPGGTGSITQVEIALEASHDGGMDRGSPDTLELSHTLGSTSQTYPLSTTDEQRFLDVTGDRSWTWSDIETLGVRATCQCHDNRNDARVFSVDALWVRVTSTDSAFQLETDRWSFDTLGAGSTHELELRYRTDSAESYDLQIWDGSTWNTATALDQGSFTIWTQTLTSGEASAGPEIRILDQGLDDGTQGSVDIDYARVVSS